MKPADGRPITDADSDQAREVLRAGEQVKRQLFAERQAVGAQVTIGDVPFTVIGVLAKKDQHNSYNGLDGEKGADPL